MVSGHVHPCPECYKKVPCPYAEQVGRYVVTPIGHTAFLVEVDGCTTEPDMTLDDGTLSGSHVVCGECQIGFER